MATVEIRLDANGFGSVLIDGIPIEAAGVTIEAVPGEAPVVTFAVWSHNLKAVLDAIPTLKVIEPERDSDDPL